MCIADAGEPFDDMFGDHRQQGFIGRLPAGSAERLAEPDSSKTMATEHSHGMAPFTRNILTDQIRQVTAEINLAA